MSVLIFSSLIDKLISLDKTFSFNDERKSSPKDATLDKSSSSRTLVSSKSKLISPSNSLTSKLTRGFSKEVTRLLFSSLST